MGVVWLGNDEILGRDVAVKLLVNAVSSADDPSFRVFVEGARAAAAVRHTGLTEIYHAGVVEGVPFLVMEFIDGPVLNEILGRAGSLGVGATLGVLEAVCAATAELHDRGIVHRDIKPSNILLDSAWRIVMTDFGLACSRPLGAIRGGAPDGVAGTPHYMAPEMFDGVVSVRADVYALGIVAFELITGDVPYTGSVEEVVRGHRLGTLPADPLARRNVAPPLVDVLARAAHAEALYRYKTAGHLLRALHEACPEPGAWSQAREAAAVLVASSAGVAIPPPKPGVAAANARYYDYLDNTATKKRVERPATDPPPGAEPGVPPEQDRPGTVVVFVPCVQCGYDLRGLPADGRCSECGTEVRSSLSPDRLMFADAAWLAGLKRAFVLLGLAWHRWWLLYLAWVLVLIVVFVVTVRFVSLVPNPPPRGFGPTGRGSGMWMSPVADFVPLLIILPLVPVGVYGGWLLTRPQPGAGPVAPRRLPPRPAVPGWRGLLFGDARRATGALPALVSWRGAWLDALSDRVPREAARILARVLMLGAPGMVVLLFVWPLVSGRSPAMLFLALFVLPIAAICLHVGALVERIPDRRLALRAFAAAAGALVAGAGMVVFELLPRGLWRSFVGSSASLLVLLAVSTLFWLSLYAAGTGAKSIRRSLKIAVPLREAVREGRGGDSEE